MNDEHILIIDDSREIVKHLTDHVLPTFGYNTFHAFDGQTGLAYIREKKPDLDHARFQFTRNDRD